MDAAIISLFPDAAALHKLGLWLLLVGLIGDVVVIFVPNRRVALEKFLAVMFTLMVFAGVWMESVADDWLAAPRTFSDAQITAAVSRLHPFAGQTFVIFAYWGGKEDAAFTGRILDLLGKAGWVRVVPIARSMELAAGMTGVFVSANQESPAQTQYAADSLVTALADAGIDDVKRKIAANTIPDNEIMISVGAKP